ncbi:MAG: alkaline phosphatase family protein [Rhodospirillales bacterium]|nr:alkaline phosphatase family protein [Rhodospirillales bacterium]
MKPNAKVLFIGLDGLEPELALEMCEAGELPVLQSLREKGVWGMNASTPGFGDGAIWSSVMTGVNPAKHGRYFYHQLKTGTYQTYFFKEDTDFKHEPMWAEFSRAGKRVAVIDMFHAPLTKGLNGIQIADWLTHDREDVPRSWPPELIKTVIDRYGDDPFGGQADAPGRKTVDYIELYERILDRVETKAEMSCAYLDQGPWDLFMTVFADAHDLGHQCWHMHDPSHPQYDAQLFDEIGDPVKQTYIRIDRGVGRLIEKAGPGATVIVLGGLGMESGYTANFIMDQILRRLESPPGAQGLTYVDKLKEIYRTVAPRAVRKRLGRLGQRSEQKMLVSDRHDRKCFFVPNNDNCGAVRINRVGREPEGKVDPSDLDAYVDELTKDLKDIVNLETGESLVKEVVRVSEHCAGDHLDDLPDLLVEWNRPKPIRKIGSPKIGEIEAEYPGNRTGDHTKRMLLVACGPGIEPAGQIFNTSVTDIGPTIGALLGVTTQDMDGKVILELAATQ